MRMPRTGRACYVTYGTRSRALRFRSTRIPEVVTILRLPRSERQLTVALYLRKAGLRDQVCYQAAPARRNPKRHPDPLMNLSIFQGRRNSHPGRSCVYHRQ